MQALELSFRKDYATIVIDSKIILKRWLDSHLNFSR